MSPLIIRPCMHLQEGWLNMAMALKEIGEVQESEAAFQKVLQLDTPESRTMQAYKVWT